MWPTLRVEAAGEIEQKLGPIEKIRTDRTISGGARRSRWAWGVR